MGPRLGNRASRWITALTGSPSGRPVGSRARAVAVAIDGSRSTYRALPSSRSTAVGLQARGPRGGFVPGLHGGSARWAAAASATLSEEELEQATNALSFPITSKAMGPFEMHQGFIPRGGDLLRETMTVEEALQRARTLPNCSGFTYKGEINTEEEVEVFFKSKFELVKGTHGQWTSVHYQGDKDPWHARLLAGEFKDKMEKVIERPSPEQLRMVWLASALPFVGFGFLDNFLMIVFGDLIDSTLCVSFNLSTMAAAAIGNTISDTAGIFSGGFVEEMAKKMGVEEPKLDDEQKELPVYKAWSYNGQVVGIVVGCVLGCCPLLWIDPNESDRKKREKDREAIFESTVTKVQDMLGAEAVALMFSDKDRRFLRSTHRSQNLPNYRWPIEKGFIGHVMQTGHFVNIAEVRDEPQYDPELHDNLVGSGIAVRSILCMPIYGEGKVNGILMVINKEKGEESFTTQDEDVLSAICSHIAVAMTDEQKTFEEVVDTCERSMRKRGAQEWSASSALQRRERLYQPALEGIRTVVGAEATALMLLDQASQELETEVIDGPLPEHKTPVGEGIAGQAVERGLVLQVDSASAGQSLDAGGAKNDDGTDFEVRSELAVPLFDTSKKCLGVVKCINKVGAESFSEDDLQYVKQVATHLETMLEGPDAGIRRVLTLSRHRMQEKIFSEPEGRANTICATLQKGESLPGRPAMANKSIDPYVTLSITHGNPMEGQEPGLAQRLWKLRNHDKKSAIRRFAKSTTVLEDCNPRWDEQLAVTTPERFQGVPREELYVHILLWDYNALKTDELVAQATIPLSQLTSSSSGSQSLELHPIAGQDGLYNLYGSRIWLSRTEQAPVAAPPTAPPAAAEGS